MSRSVNLHTHYQNLNSKAILIKWFISDYWEPVSGFQIGENLVPFRDAEIDSSPEFLPDLRLGMGARLAGYHYLQQFSML